MQNKSDNQIAGPKPNTLGNDEILEFAEEVLGAAEDDEIINLEDTQQLADDNGEEIIDLTEVADEPENEDTDVLDLTDIADEGEDLDDDDEIIDLDDISDFSEDTDEVIMDLEEVVDAAAQQDDDIMELEDIAVEPSDEDDDLLTLEDMDQAGPAGLDTNLAADEDEAESFIDEEEIELEDLDAVDDIVLDEDALPEIESGELAVDLDDTVNLGMPEDPAPSQNAAGDLPGLAPEPEDAEDALQEPAAGMDDVDSETPDDDMALQDFDLDDIADEFVTQHTRANDDFETPADFAVPDLQEDLPMEDELPLPENLSDSFEAEPVDTQEVQAHAPEADAVDLSGFESEELAGQMTTETPEEQSDETVSAIKPDTSAGHELEAAAEVEDVFETGQTDDPAAGQAENEDTSMFDLTAAAAETVERLDQLESEPGMPSDATIDELFPQAETGSQTDIEQADEPETESLIDEDLPIDQPDDIGAASQKDEVLGFDQLDEPEAAPQIDEALGFDQLDEPEDTPQMDEDLTLDQLDEPETSPQMEEGLTHERFEAATPPAMEAPAETEPVELPESMPTDSDGGLDLDLENEEYSQKTIKVVHDTRVEKEFPEPVEEPEDLSIEGITAAEDISPLEQVGGAGSVELSGTEQLEEGQASDEANFQFDRTEAGGIRDIHRTADPISIKVKEHGVEDHANADDLLKVFDNQPGPVSLEGIEPVIEQVIQKVLADKIEVLLTSAIESAVTREIDRLKNILLSDLKSADDD